MLCMYGWAEARHRVPCRDCGRSLQQIPVEELVSDVMACEGFTSISAAEASVNCVMCLDYFPGALLAGRSSACLSSYHRHNVIYHLSKTCYCSRRIASHLALSPLYGASQGSSRTLGPREYLAAL